MSFDIIEVRYDLAADNDRFAARVRERLNKDGVYLVNLMASPGAGKTSVLCRVLDAFPKPLPDLIFLENVGNLVCPAEFDVGADLKLMILSVPEGDDKPLKYPLMFTVADCMLINKLDTAPIFDFDPARCEGYVRALNPDIAIFPVSAKTGEGMEAFVAWLAGRVSAALQEKRGRDSL